MVNSNNPEWEIIIENVGSRRHNDKQRVGKHFKRELSNFLTHQTIPASAFNIGWNTQKATFTITRNSQFDKEEKVTPEVIINVLNSIGSKKCSWKWDEPQVNYQNQKQEVQVPEQVDYMPKTSLEKAQNDLYAQLEESKHKLALYKNQAEESESNYQKKLEERDSAFQKLTAQLNASNGRNEKLTKRTIDLEGRLHAKTEILELPTSKKEHDIQRYVIPAAKQLEQLEDNGYIPFLIENNVFDKLDEIILANSMTEEEYLAKKVKTKPVKSKAWETTKYHKQNFEAYTASKKVVEELEDYMAQARAALKENEIERIPESVKNIYNPNKECKEQYESKKAKFEETNNKNSEATEKAKAFYKVSQEIKEKADELRQENIKLVYFIDFDEKTGLIEAYSPGGKTDKHIGALARKPFEATLEKEKEAEVKITEEENLTKLVMDMNTVPGWTENQDGRKVNMRKEALGKRIRANVEKYANALGLELEIQGRKEY
jgi:hypothetical protein